MDDVFTCDDSSTAERFRESVKLYEAHSTPSERDRVFKGIVNLLTSNEWTWDWATSRKLPLKTCQGWVYIRRDVTLSGDTTQLQCGKDFLETEEDVIAYLKANSSPPSKPAQASQTDVVREQVTSSLSPETPANPQFKHLGSEGEYSFQSSSPKRSTEAHLKCQ
jgi:hypothetical protein